MNRFARAILILVITSLGAGCVYYPAHPYRPYAAVWVPAHWSGPHGDVWVGGHWR